MDTYTIYLVNKSDDNELFWCFLAPPEELANDKNVFANSSASLQVVSNSPAQNSFTIPVQYKVGAGASNKAVGLHVVVVSSITHDADLQDTWGADYADWPPNQGPTLTKSDVKASATEINIVSNDFDKPNNENNGHWYGNQSFGIETESGFIGMTWDPKPGQTRKLTPKLTFYVAVGDYGSNALANWDDFSNESAVIKAPYDFASGSCTVTYTGRGKWNVTAGEPHVRALARDLNWFLSDAHNELVALAYLSKGSNQADTIVSVHWDSKTFEVRGSDVFLTGTLTVTTALTAAFTYFVLAGTTFYLSSSRASGTTFQFNYNGPGTASHIMGLFTQGATLFFGGPK